MICVWVGGRKHGVDVLLRNLGVKIEGRTLFGRALILAAGRRRSRQCGGARAWAARASNVKRGAAKGRCARTLFILSCTAAVAVATAARGSSYEWRSALRGAQGEKHE